MTSNAVPAFAGALSTMHESESATADVVDQIAKSIGSPPDLLFAFVSHHHGPDFDLIRRLLLSRTKAKHIIGCTGESIVGVGREIEGQPALSVLAASLPTSQLTFSYLEFNPNADGGSFLGLPDEILDGWPEGSTMILLGDPWSFPADALLSRLNAEFPNSHVVGGMASGGMQAGQNAMFLNDRTYDAGAVALLLRGDVGIDSVVSQGCKPIGRHFVITKAEQNVIMELGGRPPLVQFQEIYDGLNADEQQLVRQGLHVGRVVNEYQSHFERGDFLLRNVIGADRESGAIAIGDYVRPGQTVQFHIRDADSADEDLKLLLSSYAKENHSPIGGLLFTCNGRGSRLFQGRDHDAAAMKGQLGPLPVAGFFAQGEIGPIGGKNFLHGFTASIGLFRGKT